MFELVVQRIDSLLGSRGLVVVAISGFGGAGKTTLADALRERFRLGDEQVLHLDRFIVDRARGEGVLGGFDWPRFTAVLTGVRAGGAIGYEPLDFDGRPTGERVVAERPPVLIVEGVRLLRPELLALFDVTLWIDCPIEVAAERGLARDVAAGAGAGDLALWDSEWVPKDRAHFELHRPDLLADFVYPAR